MELEKKQTLTPSYKCVSITGIQEIHNYLRVVLGRLLYVRFPLTWSWEWLGTHGQYRGKLPNRLAGMLKTRYDIKLTAEQKSIIGNIARKHLLVEDTYTIDFTDNFDWDAGDFGDYGSCFWGDNSGAREIMEGEGVIAIRFYDEDRGTGRAWLYELSDSAWLLFNAYGLECPEAASIFAMKLKEDTGDTWEYEELDSFQIDGNTKGFVYINSYPQIIYREDHDRDLNVDLDWSVPYYPCPSCGDWTHEDDMYYDEEDCESYCYGCYEATLAKREEERLAELEEQGEIEEENERELLEEYRYTYQQAVLAHSLKQEAIRNSIIAQLVAGQLCLGVDFQMGLSLL